MSLKQEVLASLTDIYKKTQENEIEIELEVPRYIHGDYSANIGFRLAKILKQAPADIAEIIAKQINESKAPYTASNLSGFINLKISDEYLYQYFKTFLDTPPLLNQGRKSLLEYVSANPTGPLHIGHGRWAVIGDCIYRLLTKVGQEVHREFYINDAGNQIKLFNDSIEAMKNGEELPENGYGGDFIEYIVKYKNKHFSNVDFTLDYQKTTLQKLNCEFDEWFKESSLQNSTPILDQLNEYFEKHIVEKDGAHWFTSTEFGDDKDRVIVKENGDTTYYATDILYHVNKIKRGFKRLINLWGADHHGYISRMKASIQAYNDSVDFTVILGQMVNLFENGQQIKMSKRTGKLIEIRDVIEKIGVDATRYFLVEKKPELHLDFDLDLAKKKTVENPVYYIQYAHARIHKILANCDGLKHKKDTLTLNEEERKLMIHTCRFYDALYESAESFEPYKIAQYTYELAKLFHSFYQTSPVITEKKYVNETRYTIICIVQKVIQECGDVLGISTPTKM